MSRASSASRDKSQIYVTEVNTVFGCETRSSLLKEAYEETESV